MKSEKTAPSFPRSAWERASGTLRVILFSVAVAGPALAAEHAAKAVTAEHAAAQALLAALGSGEAFRIGFAVLPPAASKDAAERQARAVSRALRNLRAELPPKPAYEFLAGVEFTLAATNEKTVTVQHPVGSEDAAQPSVFRLAPQPSQQVYLVLRVKGEGDRTWHLHALMVPAAGTWKSGGLTLLVASVGPMDAEAALAAGQKEAAASHPILALALYGLANQLGSTPRFRTSALQERLRVAHDALSKQLGIPEKPITTVEIPRGKFALSYANARLYQRGAYLLLFREAAKSDRPADPTTHQRELAAAFLKAHPEIKPYFVGIGLNERYTDPNRIEQDDRGLFLNTDLEPAGK